MSKATAKAKITSVFKTNGSAGITGANSQSALTGMLDDVYADLAEKVGTPTNGDLIKTDASGDPVDSGISASSVSSHLTSTSNPHSVTKAQVGLGNCDNTADLSKPISTATQTALDLKANVSALADKADIDGNYPLLEVGKAKDIAGADKVDAEIVFRTAGGSADIGSGTATIDKILGNSYAWNQLVDPTKLLSATRYGVTLTNNGDGSITINGTNDANLNFAIVDDSTLKFVVGHKYYLAGTPILFKDNYNAFIVDTDNGLQYDYGEGVIYTATTATTFASAIRLRTNNTGITFTNAKFMPQLFDLTLIFGAGHEPATVSALKATPIGAYICSGYHAYDAGSLLSSKETGLKTVGFNQFDLTSGKAKVLGGNQYQVVGTYTSLTLNGETITPDESGIFTPSANGELTVVGGNSTTCIHLVWSGIRNGEYEPYWASQLSLPVTTITGKLNGEGSSVVVFADGMKSAGSVRDEIVKVDGQLKKAVKRLGVVDLGTLTWNQQSAGLFVTDELVGTIKERPENAGTDNVVCGKLTWVSYPNVVNNTADNAIVVVWASSPSHGRIFARYNSAATAAAFKAAMSGVYLIYELATPQEYVLDSAINASYRIDDFGTEEIVPAQGSAPTSAPLYLSVEYGLNAKDAIRNLPKNYVSAQGDDNTLSRIESILASVYGITMTHTWDSTNGRYNIAMSGGWQPVASAPASASATGSKGQYYIDSTYLYICVASNTWKRVAIASW